MPEEFSYAMATQLIRLIQFDTWRAQVADGCLTMSGLLKVRARLDSAEFAPGPDRDLLRIEVEDVLASLLAIDPEDLPGRGIPEPDDFRG